MSLDWVFKGDCDSQVSCNGFSTREPGDTGLPSVVFGCTMPGHALIRGPVLLKYRTIFRPPVGQTTSNRFGGFGEGVDALRPLVVTRGCGATGCPTPTQSVPSVVPTQEHLSLPTFSSVPKGRQGNSQGRQPLEQADLHAPERRPGGRRVNDRYGDGLRAGSAACGGE